MMMGAERRTLWNALDTLMATTYHCNRLNTCLVGD